MKIENFLPNEAHYKVLFVIDIIDSLKEKGLVEGGFRSTKPVETKAILAYGKRLGYDEPTKQEMREILASLNNHGG